MAEWKEPKPEDPCPCESGRTYGDCCGAPAPKKE
jgi:uncharacterized protein YchJ